MNLICKSYQIKLKKLDGKDKKLLRDITTKLYLDTDTMTWHQIMTIIDKNIRTQEEDKFLNDLKTNYSLIYNSETVINKGLLAATKKQLEALQGHYVFKQSDFEMKIEQLIYNNIKLDTTTHRLFLYLLTKFTEKNQQKSTKEELENTKSIVISNAEYKEMFEIQDNKSAKKQFRCIAKTLMNIKIEFTDNIDTSNKGENKKIDKRHLVYMNIFEHLDIYDKYIIFNFGLTFAQYLVRTTIMQINNNIFKIDILHYSQAFYIAHALCFYANMKRTSVKVETLLERTSINTASDHFKRDVQNVLERNLNHLVDVGVLSNWIYKKKGEYMEWVIYFNLKGYKSNKTIK